MNDDKEGTRRINGLPDPVLGEGVQCLELDYPDELSFDENPLMRMENPLMRVESPLVGDSLMGMENPLMRVENPLVGMKRFGYEGFED